MSQMIQRGKELIRICPTDKRKIEFSKTDGKSWVTRCLASACGDFLELTDNGKEILAQTSKGLYFSKTEGKSWVRRSLFF